MTDNTLEQLEGTIQQIISFPAEDMTRLLGILMELKEGIKDLQQFQSALTKAKS